MYIVEYRNPWGDWSFDESFYTYHDALSYVKKEIEEFNKEGEEAPYQRILLVCKTYNPKGEEVD